MNNNSCLRKCVCVRLISEYLQPLPHMLSPCSPNHRDWKGPHWEMKQDRTSLPQRIPQVSIPLTVFDSASSRNFWQRSLDKTTPRRPSTTKSKTEKRETWLENKAWVSFFSTETRQATKAQISTLSGVSLFIAHLKKKRWKINAD